MKKFTLLFLLLSSLSFQSKSSVVGFMVLTDIEKKLPLTIAASAGIAGGLIWAWTSNGVSGLNFLTLVLSEESTDHLQRLYHDIDLNGDVSKALDDLMIKQASQLPTGSEIEINIPEADIRAVFNSIPHDHTEEEINQVINILK